MEKTDLVAGIEKEYSEAEGNVRKTIRNTEELFEGTEAEEIAKSVIYFAECMKFISSPSEEQPYIWRVLEIHLTNNTSPSRLNETISKISDLLRADKESGADPDFDSLRKIIDLTHVIIQNFRNILADRDDRARRHLCDVSIDPLYDLSSEITLQLLNIPAPSNT